MYYIIKKLYSKLIFLLFYFSGHSDENSHDTAVVSSSESATIIFGRPSGRTQGMSVTVEAP